MSEQAKIVKINHIMDCASHYASEGNGPAHVLYKELAELRSMFNEILPTIHPRIWDRMFAKDFIGAIREHRAIHGTTLKEAKDAVDSYRVKYFPS